MSKTTDKEHYCPARVGRPLVRVVMPTAPLPDDLRWDAAWLGGIYDGEGSANHIAQSHSHNPEVYARIERVVARLGLRTAPHVEGFYLLGPNGGRDFRQAMVDFLNWTRPTKRGRYMERMILGSHFRTPDPVEEIRPAGTGEVVSLQTTTGNHVVWGYASKNCEFVETDDQVFAHDDIRAALTDGAETLSIGRVFR